MCTESVLEGHSSIASLIRWVVRIFVNQLTTFRVTCTSRGPSAIADSAVVENRKFGARCGVDADDVYFEG